ncbi:MAG: restriction endonuclease subunit S [Thermomonas sp.]
MTAGFSAWVGELPKDWRCEWLKWSVQLSTERPSEEEQERLPYIANEDIESWTGKLLKDDPQPAESDGRKFAVDDVLFNKLRPYLAKVYHAQFDGVSSGELLCLRPSGDVLPKYLFYVLVSRGFIDTVDAETFGSKMPRADWDVVGHQPLPLPPLDTQQRIARFLDDKTARIDALIAKKRALLERLAEKRQALITRAVTKGLNPAVSMKSSGIDWLGEIPAHWEVFPVKRVAELQSGHTPDRKIDTYWEDCEIPWVSLNDTAALRDNDYISDTAIKINELGLANSSARMLPARAVVFTRDATIGESAITTKPMAVSQHIIAWLCDEARVIPEFLLFAIYGMKGELLRLTNGSTFGTIGLSDVKSISVALPPVDEQTKIVADVFSKKQIISDGETRVRASIDKLSEYRAALITAAVTGQIAELH